MDEKKIVAQIDFNWPEQPSAKEQFIEDYHHCPLCSAELIFTHVTHFVNSAVSEKAECPACNIQVKSSDHTLQ